MLVLIPYRMIKDVIISAHHILIKHRYSITNFSETPLELVS